MPEIEIEGLRELIAKFGKMPPALDKELKQRMKDSLLVLQESVPGYPPKRANQVSNYKRTGTLGKSLGVSQGGGKVGKPTVYSIKGTGANVEGRFGTDLSYAKYVIDPQRQAYMHQQWWWDMDVVKNIAEPKIKRIWDDIVNGIKKRLGL